MTGPDSISFGGADLPAVSLEEAAALILPVYYELAPSYGTGSMEGPFHILTASAELEAVDEETFTEWGAMGVHTLPALHPSGNPEACVDQIRLSAEAFLKTGKFLLSLGGDHAITIGLAGAANRVFGNIGVLQIDAHADLRDSYHGSRYNHACVMRRVADDLHLPFVQAGIRSFSPEEAAYIRSNRLSPFYAHQIDPLDHSWMDAAIDRLPESVYLTLDLDGLDPSVVPGTGTPEPGGLTYRQVVELIRRLGSRRRVVAADINELAKIPGTQVSEYTAARLAAKILIHCI